MKNLVLPALFLSLAACSGSSDPQPSAKTPLSTAGKGTSPFVSDPSASNPGMTPPALDVPTPTAPPSLMTLKNGELELTSTSINPKMKREVLDGNSTLFGLKAYFKLSNLGPVRMNLASAQVQIVTAHSHACKLTVLEITNPNANGYASFHLEGTDDAPLGPCEKLIYDVFHEGAYFDFYGVSLSGMPTGETKANLVLMMKPF